MLETIEAIYENGTFKPLQPVNLPEGSRVQIHANRAALSLEEQIRQQLLAKGSTLTEAERILDNLRLLWTQRMLIGDAGRDGLLQGPFQAQREFDFRKQNFC